jgi:hypothetical protein
MTRVKTQGQVMALGVTRVRPYQVFNSELWSNARNCPEECLRVKHPVHALELRPLAGCHSLHDGIANNHADSRQCNKAIESFSFECRQHVLR